MGYWKRSQKNVMSSKFPSLFKEGVGEFQIRSNALSPSLSKRDDADAIKRSPSLFKEGVGEFKVRSNALCPSLSKRDDADAIRGFGNKAESASKNRLFLSNGI